MDTDTLRKYQEQASKGIAAPLPAQPHVVGEGSTPLEDGFYNPAMAEAFTAVANYLARLEPDDPIERAERDIALGYLRAKHGPQAVNTEEGQRVAFVRDDQMHTTAVIIVREDGQSVVSSDMQFPFAQCRELDAIERRVKAEVLGEPLPPLDYGSLTGNDRYREVARLYNEAVEKNLPRKETLIMEAMGVSHGVARTNIRRARERGFLPPSTYRKAKR